MTERRFWSERRKRYGRMFIAAVAVVLLLAGCGKQFDVDVPSGDMDDDELIVVGVSQIGSESVWRTANTASIQEVCTKENG